jgi:hypothetical protein
MHKLSGYEIESYLNHLDSYEFKFLGAFSCIDKDITKAITNNIFFYKKIALVLHIQDHWIALVLDCENEHIECFDSGGRGDYYDCTVLSLKELGWQWTFNTRAYKNTGVECGYYCIWFIIMRSRYNYTCNLTMPEADVIARSIET